ncbi:MFS family permease [Candidatus Methanophagaceae archaeon]|nr:MFS family permease [Methanophagales archaeon]
MEEQRENSGFLGKWGVLILLSLAEFIIVIDTTIMNVAITALVHDLNTNIASIQFAIALYSLVIAAFTLTGGKLGDIIGMKRTFIIGTAIYGVGTIIAALSMNVLMLLVGWSVIEGIGAALMMPLAVTLILVSYEGKERAVSFGVIGAMAAIGAAMGPIVGGFLTTYASWRWAFALEVVVVVIIIAFSYLLKESEIHKRATLDYFGVSLSAIGLACIILGIIEYTISLIGVGIIVLILFFVWQKRQELKKKMPLVRLAIFKNRQFVSGFLTDTLESLVLAGIMFILPVFLQQGLGYNAFETGVVLLPMSIAVFVVSIATAPLGHKIAPKILVQVGIVITGIGAFIIREALSMQVSDVELLPGLGIMGIGIGLMLAQLSNITMSAVKEEERGEASGVAETMKSMGSSLGTAIIGAVLIAALFSCFTSGVQQSEVLDDSLKSEIITGFESSVEHMDGETIADEELNQPKENLDELDKIAENSFISAMKTSFDVMILCCIICLIISVFLPKSKL